LLESGEPEGKRTNQRLRLRFSPLLQNTKEKHNARRRLGCKNGKGIHLISDGFERTGCSRTTGRAQPETNFIRVLSQEQRVQSKKGGGNRGGGEEGETSSLIAKKTECVFCKKSSSKGGSLRVGTYGERFDLQQKRGTLEKASDEGGVGGKNGKTAKRFCKRGQTQRPRRVGVGRLLRENERPLPKATGERSSEKEGRKVSSSTSSSAKEIIERRKENSSQRKRR